MFGPIGMGQGAARPQGRSSGYEEHRGNRPHYHHGHFDADQQRDQPGGDRGNPGDFERAAVAIDKSDTGSGDKAAKRDQERGRRQRPSDGPAVDPFQSGGGADCRDRVELAKKKAQREQRIPGRRAGSKDLPPG